MRAPAIVRALFYACGNWSDQILAKVAIDDRPVKGVFWHQNVPFLQEVTYAFTEA